MTPRGMRYEDAYAKASPFDKLADGLLQPQMIRETAGLMRHAVENSIETNILINNRAGGNAPLIAQQLAMEFFKGRE